MTIRSVGMFVLCVMAAVAAAGPFVAPNPTSEQHRDHPLAPPMRPRLRHTDGRWQPPFVYPLRLVDRLERRYEVDRSRPVPLVWLSGGKLVRIADETQGPLLLLGSDSLGRDVFSRLVMGTRVSLGVAGLAVLGALALGTVAGAVAGYVGGLPDEALMRLSEFVLVLPAVYVILALRAVMPLVLPPATLFLTMSAVLGLVGWPYVARGVRAIVASERLRDYAAAARSLGAGPGRILFRHLLPSAAGFLVVQAALLLPAFILAETTLSYIGLGFAEPTPSWGGMLAEAANIRAIAEFPWLLSPALAIVPVVLSVNILMQARGGADALSFPEGAGLRLGAPRPSASDSRRAVAGA